MTVSNRLYRFLFLMLENRFYLSFSEKSASTSDILICCGQTCSQERHCRQADGCFSGGNLFIRAQRLQLRFVLWSQPGQLASAQRPHHPNGNTHLTQQIDLFLPVLETPVQIIQLKLTELHILAVGVQKASENTHIPLGILSFTMGIMSP